MATALSRFIRYSMRHAEAYAIQIIPALITIVIPSTMTWGMLKGTVAEVKEDHRKIETNVKENCRQFDKELGEMLAGVRDDLGRAFDECREDLRRAFDEQRSTKWEKK